MCGIIGYTGCGDGVGKTLSGLKMLEYRGYDSAGIAFNCDDEVRIIKTKGRVKALIEMLDSTVISNTVIGHTRWATHGAPSSKNAHPHRVGMVTVVHNGIIENYREHYKRLINQGYTFVSDTDTEVAAAIINEQMKVLKTPERALATAISKMNGKYALAVLFDDYPGKIYTVRYGSPLVIAQGTDGYFISSDINAIASLAYQYYVLPEHVIGVLCEDHVELVCASGKCMELNWVPFEAFDDSTSLGKSESYMMKEMHETPQKLKETVLSRIYDGLPSFIADGISELLYRRVEEVQIVACGSARHAGLVGEKLLEKLAGVSTTVHIASEYRYNPVIFKRNVLVILISQSGETADTLAALNYAKSNGFKTLSIVNVIDSSIARESDFNIYTKAGPEIAVATTKGYVAQLAVLWELAIAFAFARGKLHAENARKIIGELITDAPMSIDTMLLNQDEIIDAINIMKNSRDVFYIGRGIDFALVLEGALKLKEISYVHAEAYAAGEMKHGAIALIEEGTPVVAIATDCEIYFKIENNVRELKARGAKVVLIAPEDARGKIASADVYVNICCKSRTGAVFGAVTAMQMIAYNIAKQRKCDIDHPRNLAKSVTVE